MANQSKKTKAGERNSERSNGKAGKKNPKVNPTATGRTQDGYTFERKAKRAVIREKMFRGLTE